MHTKTQKLMLQGGLILLGALLVSSIGGWARRATASDQPATPTAPPLVGGLRPLEQALQAAPGGPAGPPAPLGPAAANNHSSTQLHNPPAPPGGGDRRSRAA